MEATRKSPPSDDEMLELVKQDIRRSLGYLNQMNALFHFDTMRAFDLCRTKEEEFKQEAVTYEEYGFWLRGLIRTSFAHIEGVTFLMRQFAVWSWERSELSLAEAEAAKLAEEEVTGEGDQKRRRKRFNSFQENFELAFRYFPQAFGASFRLNKGDVGWPTFLRAIQVRNAVTHPKKPSEFMISGTALKDVRDTVIWFGETMSSVLNACAAASRNRA
jgi:hypothetical protein